MRTNPNGAPEEAREIISVLLRNICKIIDGYTAPDVFTHVSVDVRDDKTGKLPPRNGQSPGGTVGVSDELHEVIGNQFLFAVRVSCAQGLKKILDGNLQQRIESTDSRTKRFDGKIARGGGGRQTLLRNRQDCHMGFSAKDTGKFDTLRDNCNVSGKYEIFKSFPADAALYWDGIMLVQDDKAMLAITLHMSAVSKLHSEGADAVPTH